MLYLFYGDAYQIKKEIDKLIKENGINTIDINKYDLDAYNYKDIILDAESVSLFDDKKMIIVEDADIFTSSKISFDPIDFEKYIDNPNPNTIMIFTVGDKIDERKKIVKSIKKTGIVKEFAVNNNPISMVQMMLDNYKMDNFITNKFLELVGNDTYNISNEIDKLKLYKGDDNNITSSDVDDITTKNIEVDLFGLMDAIIENNKEKAIEKYHNMLLYNTEPIQIIIALANKYRLMYQVKNLFKKGYTEGDIARELKQNPKYIFVLNKISKSYSNEYLLEQLKNMADLDFNIKSGKMDASLALELYILKK